MLLLALSAILRGFLWIGLLPPWQGPDEPSHYAFVERLANWSYPNRISTPENYASAALVTSIEHTAYILFLTHDQRRPFSPELQKALTPEPPNLSQSAAGALSASNYPPLYYAFLVPLFHLPGLHTATSRLYAVRVGSALFAGVLVVLTFLLIREIVSDDALAIAGAALISLPPMITQASAIVNPDIGLATACTGLALAALRVTRRGPTIWRLLAVAAFALAAAFMKPYGVVAAATIGGPLLCFPFVVRRTGHAAAVALAVTAVGGIGLFVVSLRRFGLVNWTNARFSIDYLWQFYLPPLPFMSRVFTPHSPLTVPVPAWQIWGITGVGDFGWVSAPLRLAWVELGAASVGIAGLVAAGGYLFRRRALTRWQVVAVGSCVIALLLYVLGLHAAEAAQMLTSSGNGDPVQGRILQGRYLIPVAPLFLAAMLVGLRAWSRRLALVTEAVLIAVWFFISLTAINTVVHFYAS